MASTYIYSNDVCHREECGDARTNLGQESCILDFFFLRHMLAIWIFHWRVLSLTCPEPSRRKIRPKVDAPILSLTEVHVRLIASMIKTKE